MKREKYQAMKKAVEAKRQARAEAAKPMPAVELVKPAPSEPTGGPKKMKPPRRPFAADAEIHQKGRFPVGTYFVNPLWDGKVWKTKLIVPVPTDPARPNITGHVFDGEDTALHRLFVRLYAEYRKWADAQPKEVPLA